ncbi:endonuclease domain-containing protein [uncultured Roseibium sp.]|uniref:endonuclease domain-containing protein n=1 Tax=uncultured Roseibium sp. TaxID=1936171 RepID=UPI0026206A23|nr:endonuclease domain-containing protein [uncultured Roseibium sp.]
MAPTQIDASTRKLARKLRLDQTKGEKALWRVLRELKADNIHIRRQAPIGPYVADFVIFSRKVVIEIDGDIHDQPDQLQHDQRRAAWLRAEGFQILRYSSLEVDENLEGVVLDIRRWLGLD